MELIATYECLCDSTRLRILTLLREGPLCVCHIQEILGEPQVKISKHLGYLRQRGLVRVTQEANWRIYALMDKLSPVLAANLACLQDCAGEDQVLARDRAKLHALRRKLGPDAPSCCSLPSARKLPSESAARRGVRARNRRSPR